MRRQRANLDLLSELSESAPNQDADRESDVSRENRSGRPTYSVSQVAALVKDVLVDAIPGSIRVVGEISNFSDRSHWFFSLKDDSAALRCVCFASRARAIGFRVQDGMQVVATGRIDFYDARGDLQLYVDAIEPVGQGALELRFRALCEQLRQLGYFEPEPKKPLPPMPRTVAVLTSRSGAALQDVIDTAAKRWAGCRLLLFDVRVQGELAAPEIAQAIRALSEHGHRIGIDAIILTRGGGSIEDLWAFNERDVADAIFECTIPIVAAIGHETDTTIAELVADVRCATPTQAAMTLIPDKATLSHQVDVVAHRLGLQVARRLEFGRERLNFVARHPLFRHPRQLLDLPRNRIDRSHEQLVGRVRERVTAAYQAIVKFDRSLSAMAPRSRIRLGWQQLTNRHERFVGLVHRAHERAQTRLAALDQQLEAIHPANVLDRGFSYTLGPDGQVLRSFKAVKTSDPIVTVLADGRIRSRVEDTNGTDAATAGKPARRSSRRGPRGVGQPSLFDEAGEERRAKGEEYDDG